MFKQKQQQKYVRVNRNINISPVRVVKNGENLGIMPTDQAQALAYQYELDLVEVVPNAKPPVCSIMDFGKYRFEQKKKIKEQKQKNKPIAAKEIRLRPVSEDHDVEIKINQLKKFIEEKRIVSVSVVFKRRELQHRERGKFIIEKVIQAVQSIAKVESPPRFEGKNLTVRFIPLAK